MYTYLNTYNRILKFIIKFVQWDSSMNFSDKCSYFVLKINISFNIQNHLIFMNGMLPHGSNYGGNAWQSSERVRTKTGF